MSEKLFNEESGMQLAAQNDAAAVARATQEIQAALVVAQRYGRNVIKAKSKIIEACQRKELAEVAEYEYSRGGTKITGPTIDLLRAIANRWGNIRYGWSEVERRDGYSSVRCFAWDLETNGQAERTFSVKHWRDTQGGGYELKDERDIYELLANMAARRVRACLEEVIDADVVDAAIEQVRLTMRSGEKTPLIDRAVKMLVPFGEFGVTQGMIEARLGNKLDAVSENQLASLRRVYKSLKDGVGKREDYFKAELEKPEFSKPQSAPKPDIQPEREPDTGEGTDLGPTEPAKAPGNGGQNYLRAVRMLCQSVKVKESELMAYMVGIGLTNDTLNSLDEVALMQMSALQSVYDHWADVSGKIIAARKGGAK
jgi:hypothetical protein